MNAHRVVAKAKAAAVGVNAILAAARIAGNRQSRSVFFDKGKVLVEEVAVPERPRKFALLQLILAGICNTDLQLLHGYYNFHGIPGHEFVARVVDCDTPSLIHRRVVGEINLACGSCEFCTSGLLRHCSKRSVLGIIRHPGAFSEYFTLPEANLHVLPDSISSEEAVFTEPLAAACEILDQIQVLPRSEVAVLGDGKLGLLIAQALLSHDLQVTVFGRHESKLQLARCAGARTVITSELPKAIYSCVIECTGSPDGLAGAIQMTRPRGTIVLKSTIHQQLQIDMASVIVNEITLLGSRCGRFEPAIALLQNKMVNVAPMISSEFPLEEAIPAIQKAASRGTLKVLLRNSRLDG